MAVAEVVVAVLIVHMKFINVHMKFINFGNLRRLPLRLTSVGY
ncbi:hypothetical protein COLO4_35157 [Corchorus olitorius]|uniref:Uncharacterized protein n=1 Tax=Corchorus olitorius TaxID=93759 RepID=A0A1R3GI19_9ROSI|nr:hypothetical protein COLO4_35157 [Corchorus olitorius]